MSITQKSYGPEVSQIRPKIGAVSLIIDSLKANSCSKTPPKLTPDEVEQRLLSEVFSSVQENGCVVEENDPEILVSLSEKHGDSFFNGCIRPVGLKLVANIEFTETLIKKTFEALKRGKLEIKTIQTFYKDICTRFVNRTKQKVNNRNGTTEYEAPSTWYERIDSKPIGGTRIAQLITDFLAACEEVSLPDSREQLVDLVLDVARRSGPECFETLLLPLLQRLLPLVEGMDQRVYEQLFREVLSLYLRSYVSPKPERPQDWKRSMDQAICKRQCEDCMTVQRFATASNEESRNFVMAYSPRSHIIGQLSNHKDLEVTIDRTKSPHQLFIRKTEGQWHHDVNLWKGRCREARKMLNNLDQEKLTAILGEEKLKEIVAMLETIKKGEQNIRMPLGDVGQGNQTNKRKRPPRDENADDNLPISKRRGEVEIVDLCEH
ncbi:uncharacterized protein KY384_001828 [Bacidia gigantensis]|uniref:uncharacterized protein n=1 Tax=Bacidia gigantensis TaxID=2732470 RepID=UPI001D044636|nr:uncharacterized protein KY384_001828 [Bacidia gigantensis]KAG8533045.1 hypothetical protein KY384_001828 [Bacidia gigantensis]